MLIPKSSIPLIHWPAIPDKAGSLLLSILYQLEQTQWWSEQEIRKHQFQQLGNLIQHAQKTVPFYHQHFRNAGVKIEDELNEDSWSRIPLLSSNELKTNSKLLCCKSIPNHHGKVAWGKTSGTTGEPLQFLKTEIVEMFWRALTVRDQLWHERDYRQKLTVIRSGRYVDDPHAIQEYKGWGKASNTIYATGPSNLIYHRMPIEKQMEVLLSQQPHYLLLYPSNVYALAQYCKEKELALPDLQEIITYGEPLYSATRSFCEGIFNVKITDGYSTEETGYIALQCPENEHYHIQSEALLVEVLNDQDQQCQAGEIGRVVLTSLYNFAMPFIRYDIGDYAEVGEPCSCGRGLPVLKRILGRARNAISQHDGSYRWPDITKIINECALPIRQLQIIQKDKTTIDVGFSAQRALDASEQEALYQKLHSTLGDAFQLSLTMHDDIPRHANGKFEYVINETITG